MSYLLCVLALTAWPLLADNGAGEGDQPEQGATAPAEDAGRLLRLSYESDEELTYRIELSGLGSVDVAGMAQAIAISGSIDMTLEVEKVSAEGNFTIYTRVDGSSLKVTVDGQPMPMTQQLPQMRTVITPRGETLEFEMLGQTQQTGMEAQISQMLTAENFKQLLAVQKMAAFPEEAVAPGDEWSGRLPGEAGAQAEAEGEAPTQITTTYVADEEFDERMCARLESEAVIAMESLGQIAGLLQMSGTTTADTTTWFDFEAGRVLATHETGQVNLELSVPAELTQGQGEIGIFMEMFIESDTTLLPPAEE